MLTTTIELIKPPFDASCCSHQSVNPAIVSERVKSLFPPFAVIGGETVWATSTHTLLIWKWGHHVHHSSYLLARLTTRSHVYFIREDYYDLQSGIWLEEITWNIQTRDICNWIMRTPTSSTSSLSRHWLYCTWIKRNTTSYVWVAHLPIPNPPHKFLVNSSCWTKQFGNILAWNLMSICNVRTKPLVIYLCKKNVKLCSFHIQFE